MAKEHITKTGVIRNTISGRERFLLTQRIMAEYKSSGNSDDEFAANVSKDLGFHVTGLHVGNIRRDFEIPANSQSSTGASNSWRSEVAKRLETLESQMETLLRERRKH